MSLSGWCSVRGRPDCKRCRWAGCECPGCANPAQPRAIPAVQTARKWENETRPQGALTPAASDHPPLTKNERG